MLWEAFHEEEEEKALNITRGWLLLSLAFATSIDALAVGLSFAFLDVGIVSSSLIFGAVTFVITVLGFYVGRQAESCWGSGSRYWED